jgi:hypothetical protein
MRGIVAADAENAADRKSFLRPSDSDGGNGGWGDDVGHGAAL